jgi:transcriptional regulator with XRE-family HTH domain
MQVFEGLGKALRWLREKQGKRQYQVAEMAGITKAMLSAYETGKQKPSLETLEKILDAMNLGLDELSNALDLVNERPQAVRRSPAPAPLGPLVGMSPDVRSLLGVDSLPHEEEQALGEMLHGFHRLIRYLHHNIAEIRQE